MLKSFLKRLLVFEANNYDTYNVYCRGSWLSGNSEITSVRNACTFRHAQCFSLVGQSTWLTLADVHLFSFFQEENDQGEFFLSLDKDPLQEDFLQGRMVGNPYSSNEPGLGPLMRDVKNKICRGEEIHYHVINCYSLYILIFISIKINPFLQPCIKKRTCFIYCLLWRFLRI